MGGATSEHTLEAHTLFTYSADSGKENAVSGTSNAYSCVVLNKQTLEGNTQKGVRSHVDI